MTAPGAYTTNSKHASMLPGRENTSNTYKPLTCACKWDCYNHFSIVARCLGNKQGKQNAWELIRFQVVQSRGRLCYPVEGDPQQGRMVRIRGSLRAHFTSLITLPLQKWVLLCTISRPPFGLLKIIDVSMNIDEWWWSRYKMLQGLWGYTKNHCLIRLEERMPINITPLEFPCRQNISI